MAWQALFVLILAVSCALMAARLTTGHAWGDDFAGYLAQAKSLVEGTVWEYAAANGYAMGHSSWARGPSTYPWGLPALLAPIYAFRSLDLLALKTVGLACYAAFLLVLHRGFAQEHPGLWRALFVGLFAFHPGLMGFVNTIMADIPFLLFSTLTLVLLKRIVIQRREILSGAWDAALLGLVLTAACAVRSNGILLFPALALAQLQAGLAARADHRARRDLTRTEQSATPSISLKQLTSVLGPYAVFLLLTAGMVLVLPSGDASYLEYWKRLTPEYVLGNVRYYAWLPTEFFLGREAYYHASIPFLLIGVAMRWRTDLPALAYSLLSVALFCLWPSRQGLRFLLPVLPITVSFALSGVQAVAQGLRRVALLRPLAWAPALVPAVLVFLLLEHSAQLSRLNLQNGRVVTEGPFSAAAQDMFRFVGSATRPQDVIIFRRARVMRLLTDRMTLMRNTVEGLAAGDYLVLGQGQGLPNMLPEDAVPGVSFPARLVYRNERFQVYALK